MTNNHPHRFEVFFEKGTRENHELKSKLSCRQARKLQRLKNSRMVFTISNDTVTRIEVIAAPQSNKA